MPYEMLESGQGTFVLRRRLHLSGAEPVKRPDRSIELRLGAEGRFAASIDGGTAHVTGEVPRPVPNGRAASTREPLDRNRLLPP